MPKFGHSPKGHKFVLEARGEVLQKMVASNTLIDWSHFETDIAKAVIRWIYSDRLLSSNEDEDFILSLMKAGKTLALAPLLEQCEESLLSSVNESNCIKFYSTAHEIEAEILKSHCSELISANWVSQTV